MAINQFELTLVSSKKVTPSVLELSFKKTDDQPLNYIPGQFITFLLTDDAGQIKRRSYSLVNMPGQTDTLDIVISYVKGGIASETLFNLKPGETLKAMGPAGRLIIADEHAVPKTFLVGTGTGIAPYRCMLPGIETLLKTHPELSFHILLGVQYRHDVLYGEDFRAYAARCPGIQFDIFYSREDSASLADDEHQGYVQTGLENRDFDTSQNLVYLCGNPNMIDDTYTLLTEKGLDAKTVRREKYISAR